MNLIFCKIQKKPHILGVFLGIIPKMRYFSKYLGLSVFFFYSTLTSCRLSENSYEQFRRTGVKNRQTDRLTDRGKIIEPLLTYRRGSKKVI